MTAVPDQEQHAPGRVAVVIVNYRTPALAIETVRSLQGERADNPGLGVTVVDGGSGDGSAETLAAALAAPEFAGWVTLLPMAINGGFGWANNQAMLRLLQSDDPPAFIHLLNPDAVAEPGAVAALAARLRAEPKCGAAGSRLLNADGSVSGSAFRFPSIAREFVRGARTPAIGRALGIADLLVESDQAVEVDWVTGASVMLRSAALREAGLFDEGFFLYFEEVELMARLRRAGWSVWHEPASVVRHIGGAATGLGDAPAVQRKPRVPAYYYRSRRRFFARAKGPMATAVAGLAWTAGHLVWRARRAAGLARQHAVVEAETRDHLAHLMPSRPDRTGAVVRWDAPVDQPPAWMRWQT